MKLKPRVERLLHRMVPNYPEFKRRYWRSTRLPSMKPPRPLSLETRELLPHLDDYRAMFQIFWLPFVMNSTYPKVRTPTVNTDGHGFRYTINDSGDRMSPEAVPKGPKNLLLGASVAFGVGATSDAMTVPSMLSASRNEAWLNMAGRGFVFAQNLVQMLFFLPRIDPLKEVVLFGGINDINQYFLTPLFPRIYGCYHESQYFFERMNAQFKQTAHDTYEIPADFDRCFKEIRNPDRDREAFEESLRNTLSALKLVSQAKGARFSLVLEPVIHWMARKLSPEEERLMAQKSKPKTRFERRVGDAYRDWYAAFLMRTCEELDIPYLDLNRHFQDDRVEGDWLFIDNVHLTDAGYKEATRLIDQLLREPA